jgi:hypothetical protein
MELQDYIDILNLIQGAAIRFDQAERALELKKKIEREINKLQQEQSNEGIYNT